MAANASSYPLTVLIAGMFSGAAAQAQSFDYPDFSSVAGLAMNGGAAQSGVVLRMNTNIGNQSASCYYDTPVSVAGGFDCVFAFQITNGGGTSGADGMTFIIHNDLNGVNALGDLGSPLGYSQFAVSPPGTAIENGLVVEIDTWNQTNGDLSFNTVSVHTSGSAPLEFDESESLGQIDPPLIDMSDGGVHTMRVQHDGSLLNVYLDDLANPILTFAYSFATGGTYASGVAVGGLNLIGGTAAYVGFTASTGGVSETHDIISWSWTSGSGVGTNYCLSTVNSTGFASTMSATGSESLSANDLVLSANNLPSQPGIFIAGPGQGQAPFFNGFLCIATSGLQRFVNTTAPTAGVITEAVDYATAAMGGLNVVAGSSYNYQRWNRDPAAGGGNANFSDGLEITHTP